MYIPGRQRILRTGRSCPCRFRWLTRVWIINANCQGLQFISGRLSFNWSLVLWLHDQGNLVPGMSRLPLHWQTRERRTAVLAGPLHLRLCSCCTGKRRSKLKANNFSSWAGIQKLEYCSCLFRNSWLRFLTGSWNVSLFVSASLFECRKLNKIISHSLSNFYICKIPDNFPNRFGVTHSILFK